MRFLTFQGKLAFALCLFLQPLVSICQQPLSFLKRQDYLSDNMLQTRLDSIIDQMVMTYMQSPQNNGLSIALHTAGKDHFYNYGEIKRNSGEIPTDRTLYETGAVTQCFNGLLLAMAINERLADPEQDVRKYLSGNFSGLHYYDEPIRLKHLVHHTSGLPLVPDNIRARGFDSLNPFAHYDKEMLYAFLKKYRPEKIPGESYQYSTCGMMLLGVILENIYKKDLPALLDERILKPYGLQSGFVPVKNGSDAVMAEGHDADGALVPHWSFKLTGAGGIVSGSADLLEFLKHFLSKNEEVFKIARRMSFTGRSQTAMGWFVKQTDGGNTMYWQSGGTGGFSCFTAFIKESDMALVILSNSAMNVEHLGISFFRYLRQ